MHPRELWDKILASPHFACVNKTDLFKLLMCYPDKNWREGIDKNRMLADDKSELSTVKQAHDQNGSKEPDNRLEAHLPKIKYVDLKGRKRNGQAEFIIVTQYEVDAVMAFEADTMVDKEVNLAPDVKSEGL